MLRWILHVLVTRNIRIFCKPAHDIWQNPAFSFCAFSG